MKKLTESNKDVLRQIVRNNRTVDALSYLGELFREQAETYDLVRDDHGELVTAPGASRLLNLSAKLKALALYAMGA